MKHLSNKEKLVFYYFLTCAFLVLLMVVIGGITRLTGSGLSITEWKPVTGIVPPLSDSDWVLEFAKYKSTPEFLKINSTMDLGGFKKIYLLEYIHRLAARITGLVFFVPAILLWRKNYLSPSSKQTLVIGSILGLAQGFMGWYMVKSGLHINPYVSHFRLSFHLLLALSLYLLFLSSAYRIYFADKGRNSIPPIYLIFISLIILQIFLGGMVAGLHGGLVYNHFPLMGDGFAPEEMSAIPFNLYLATPAIVQFFHRIGAYALFCFIILISLKLYKSRQIYLSLGLITIFLLQFFIGIYTLVYSVPIMPAWAHQFMAFILAGFALLIARKSSV
ncbi:MAG: COX15/CtaA family protein [Rickettsiaceae bacterium]|nr:COX15/CtaA family protein [Rickettsiaceae bacterium]